MASSVSEVDSTHASTHSNSTHGEDDPSSVSTRQRQKGKLGRFLQRQTKSHQQQERRGSHSSQASSATSSSLNSSLASGSLFAPSIGANSQASSKNSHNKKPRNLFRRAWEKRRSSKQKLRSSSSYTHSNASVSSSVASELDHDLEAFLEKTLPADNIHHINSVVEEYQLLAAEASQQQQVIEEPEEDKSTTTQQREQQLNHLRSELAQAESDFLALQQLKEQQQQQQQPEQLGSEEVNSSALDDNKSPKFNEQAPNDVDAKEVGQNLHDETSTTHLDAVEEEDDEQDSSSSSPSESELVLPPEEDYPREVTNIMTPSATEELISSSMEMKDSSMKEVLVISPLTPSTVLLEEDDEEGTSPNSLEAIPEPEPTKDAGNDFSLAVLTVPSLAATTSAVLAVDTTTAPTESKKINNFEEETTISDPVHGHDEQVDRIWSDELDLVSQEEVQCQYEAFLDQKMNLFEKHYLHDDEADVLLEQQMKHFEELQNQPIVMEPVLLLEGDGNLEEESDYFLEQKMEVFEKLFLHDDVSDELLQEKLQLFDSFYGSQNAHEEEDDSDVEARELESAETGPSEAEILLEDMVGVFVV